MKLEEEGLKNACGTWTMLAFYVPGAQNCTTTKSSAVWVVNFAFCRTAGTHGPRMVAGGHIACCFMLRFACVVSEHSGGAAFSDRNVLWEQQQLGIWKGKGWSLMGLLYQCKQNLQVEPVFGHWCLLCLQGRVWRVFLFPSDERTAYKASQTFSLCFDSEVGSPIPLRCKRHLGSL